MSHSKFWIVGGEFTSTDFSQVVAGTEQLQGPFNCREEAMTTWRNISEERRGECNVRYIILSEPAAGSVAQ
ncbi:DUF4170 domain-containing protein [Kiloniella sp. b19]|uniref:DUF4170 domain-containing protein n=1 Tax=Kiloniella sp. GXU_MW_B19 TaxID=3141326 RepID=UPI0031CE679A